jgi:thioredoxin-like negative regulator of GroEL
MNKLDKDEAFADVLKKEPIVVAVFGATWCAPCKELKRTLKDGITKLFEGTYFLEIDVDEHPVCASQNGVRSIPAMLLFKGGKLIDGITGAQSPSQIRAFLAK